jgi:hypothetical protein
MMQKRCFLEYAAAAFTASLLPVAAMAQTLDRSAPMAQPDEPPPSLTLAAAWRSGAGVSGDCVGLLHVDWVAGLVAVKAAVSVPTRAHGLLAEPGGGFVAVASRPGQWLLRCDAKGQVVQWHRMEDESGGRTLDGHVCASLDGEWLYTAETNPLSGQGWVGVRERRSLRKVAEWRTHGVEPHQLLLDATGALVVANGGILRTDGDKKRDLHLMDSSLVRLNPVTGERLGQWRLKDPRLSLRHLAWSHPDSGVGIAGQAPPLPLLGIALQAEHDDLTQRRAAPVLAVWDGEKLQTPSPVPAGDGYAGDIAAGPEGGFVVSCQRVSMAVHWRPSAPADLVTVAQLQEVCALAPWPSAGQSQGVLLGAARGLGRWHPTMAPGFLRWPNAMSLDNHWVMV